MAHKKKPKPAKSLILRIVMVCFVLYTSVLLIDMQINVTQRRQELEVLKVKYEQQRLANKEIERQLAIGDDQEYVERIAREKLDFVAPDEKVFIDISGN